MWGWRSNSELCVKVKQQSVTEQREGSVRNGRVRSRGEYSRALIAPLSDRGRHVRLSPAFRLDRSSMWLWPCDSLDLEFSSNTIYLSLPPPLSLPVVSQLFNLRDKQGHLFYTVLNYTIPFIWSCKSQHCFFDLLFYLLIWFSNDCFVYYGSETHSTWSWSSLLISSIHTTLYSTWPYTTEICIRRYGV